MTISLTFSTADWINIAIASIAFITSIIALFTINEMRKQRIHSYFPDLNMANFKFYLYKGDYDSREDSIILYCYKNKKELNEPINGYNELTIGINNIGFGVAKNIKWSWNFNIDLAQQEICKNTKIKWILENDYLGVKYNKLNIDWYFNINSDNIGGNANFILPYSYENKAIEIVIPEYFIFLYWLYVVSLLEDETLKTLDLNFPPLELNLNYTDIHSNNLTKVFFIELHFDIFRSPYNETNELALLRFEIKEK